MGGTARPPGQGPYVMLTTQSDFSVGACGQCVSQAGVGTAQDARLSSHRGQRAGVPCSSLGPQRESSPQGVMETEAPFPRRSLVFQLLGQARRWFWMQCVGPWGWW